MDATAPTNPAGMTVPEENNVSDITGDLETESARSRSVLGTELQVNTAREGQVALTEAALRSHTAYTPTTVASYRPSVLPVPGPVAPTHISAPTIVPTLISNTYNQQNNTILTHDSGLLMEAASARHEEIVGQIRNENREQMMNLELTANSHVAQLRLEHARLENRTREMEEMASQNALLGQQAVARHQSEANAAAEQAQALHQRLRNAESSADAVVAQVEAEARRRDRERHQDALAKDDELSRMKSEMQEMMRIQQENIQLMKFDNDNLRRRLAEAEARHRPTVERPVDPHGVEGPPGLFTTHIGTPPEQPIPEPEGARPNRTEERAEAENDDKEKKNKKLKKKKHRRDDSSDSSSSFDRRAMMKLLKKVMKNKKDKDDDDDDDKETTKNKPKVKEAEKVVFPKFPKPEQYRNWRIRVREAIVAASDSPDKAHAWIAKVWEKDADEKALRDSEGFSTLDAKIMSALTNILEGDFGRQVDTFKETEAHAGRMVRGRQLLLRLHNYFATNALHGSVYDMEDLMNCKMVNDNLNAFLRNWDTILSGIPVQPDNSVLEPLFHRQVKKCRDIAHDISVYDRALEGTEQRSYQFLYNAANNFLERERLQKNRDRIARQAGGGVVPTTPAPNSPKQKRVPKARARGGKGKAGRNASSSSKDFAIEEISASFSTRALLLPPHRDPVHAQAAPRRDEGKRIRRRKRVERDLGLARRVQRAVAGALVAPAKALRVLI